MLLLNAGHEATVNATLLGWWSLFRHPEQLERSARISALVPTAVEELLRFDTPLQLFERWVLEDVEVDGAADPDAAPSSGSSSARRTATRGASPSRTRST